MRWLSYSKSHPTGDVRRALDAVSSTSAGKPVVMMGNHSCTRRCEIGRARRLCCMCDSITLKTWVGNLCDENSAPHADARGIVDPVEQDLGVTSREIFVNGPPRPLPMAVIVDDENSAFRKPREEVV